MYAHLAISNQRFFYVILQKKKSKNSHSVAIYLVYIYKKGLV